MTLGSITTRPRPASPENDLLTACRSGGYAVRYNEDDAVHRILEPTQHGNTTIGLVVIREQRIVYAEFLRTVYPWWGRSDVDPLYLEAFNRLRDHITEGRRK